MPDEENSALGIHKAFALLPRTWPPLPLAGRAKPGTALVVKCRRCQVSGRGIAKAAGSAARTAELATMPAGWSDIGPDDIAAGMQADHLRQVRVVGSLLQFDALHCVQNGDAAGAVRACQALVNAGRSIGDEQSCQSQIVRAICVSQACDTVERLLGCGEAAPADLLALQTLLQNEAAFPA